MQRDYLTRLRVFCYSTLTYPIFSLLRITHQGEFVEGETATVKHGIYKKKKNQHKTS